MTNKKTARDIANEIRGLTEAEIRERIEALKTEHDYLALMIASTGITLTGECAFCGKYADLDTTTCDDLVCESCKIEFEEALNSGGIE
jgi:hypothetical protein